MQSGLVWIVQTPLQKISGLRNNPGQNISGKIISPQNHFFGKKFIIGLLEEKEMTIRFGAMLPLALTQ